MFSDDDRANRQGLSTSSESIDLSGIEEMVKTEIFQATNFFHDRRRGPGREDVVQSLATVRCILPTSKSTAYFDQQRIGDIPSDEDIRDRLIGMFFQILN